MSYHRTYATVDLDQVVLNMKAMRKNLKRNTKILGVVKADGYGHGLIPIAWAIESYVDGYGVATTQEALLLRKHGFQKPILLLGVPHESEYPSLIGHQIHTALFQYEKAKKLSDLAISMKKSAWIHLAVDTGMGRIGMEPVEENVELVVAMSRLPALKIQGVYSHFSKADETDKSYSFLQMERFQWFLSQLEKRGIEIPMKHCSNSAGILEMQWANLNLVRAGISIYGIYPSKEVSKEQVKLSPVLELKSHITYVKVVKPGTDISYGATFQARHSMVIATVPIGYGDGYPRNLSNNGHVLIHGQKARIVGRICMDQMMVDVTGIDGVLEDDVVTLLGKDGEERITVEEIAAMSGGYHYEVTCNLGKRIPRVYKMKNEVIATKDYFHDEYKEFFLKS